MEIIAGIAVVFLYFIQKDLGTIADELKKLNSIPNDERNASQQTPNSSTTA